MTPVGRSHGNPHPAAAIHQPDWRRGGVAVLSGRAAGRGVPQDQGCAAHDPDQRRHSTAAKEWRMAFEICVALVTYLACVLISILATA